MNKLKQVLERFLPDRWRRRPLLTEEQLVSALASIDDGNPQVRAIMDLVHGQFEAQIRIAVHQDSRDEIKLRAVERAGAVLDIIELIEENRALAKQRKEQERAAAPRPLAAPGQPSAVGP